MDGGKFFDIVCFEKMIFNIKAKLYVAKAKLKCNCIELKIGYVQKKKLLTKTIHE